MGLLDRAISLDGEPLRRGGASPLKLAEEVLSAIGDAAGHIDYPGEVFEAFRSVVGFTKGALLLPDEEAGVFYPWITRGLDRTTTRRLRLPADSLSSESRRIAVEMDAETLAPLLSNREYGLVRNPLLIRLGDGDEPSALILAADGPSGGALDGELGEALRRLNGRLGGEVGRSRIVMESDEESEPMSPAEWLDHWNGRDAILVILDTSDAIDALVDAIPGLDLYRARKDVIGLIKRITGRMGRPYDAKDGRILIMFPPERLPDEDLWLHQLSLAFASAFKRLGEPPRFSAEFHPWPGGRPAVETALAGLL